MSVIERHVTGHDGGEYVVVFYGGRSFDLYLDPEDDQYVTPLHMGLMTFCGWPLPIGWVERRINRIIAREERKRARVRAREAEIKARWAD